MPFYAHCASPFSSLPEKQALTRSVGVIVAVLAAATLCPDWWGVIGIQGLGLAAALGFGLRGGALLMAVVTLAIPLSGLWTLGAALMNVPPANDSEA